MKKLFALVLALIFGVAQAAGDDISFIKRNSTDTGQVTTFPAHPTTGLGVVVYDSALSTSNNPLAWITIGSGLSVSSGVLSATAAAQVNADWNAVSGVSQILNKPALALVATSGAYTDLSGRPSLATAAMTGAYADLTGKPSLATVATSGAYADLSGRPTLAAIATSGSASDLGSGTIGAARLPALAISQTTGLQAALDAKFATPSGSTAQYVRGDGTLATLPVAVQFNYGSINARTFVASTAYQATDNTKAAVVKVSPSCTASLTLSAGGTCTIQARVGTSGVTCSTGTVVATWTNANTGALTIGLGLNQTIGSPGNIELAIGEGFILCPTSGTFTIANGIDRSQG